MRLVIATPLYPPESGGPATYASLLAELLVREDVEPVLVKFSDVRHLPMGIRHLAYMKRVMKAGKHADMILVLDPVSTGLPAAIAALLLRKPFVVKIVGDYAWEQGTQRFGVTSTLDEFVGTRRVPLQVLVLRMIQTWVARRAKKIVVPSKYLRKIVMAWGLPEEKIAVIYNAMRSEPLGAIPHEISTLPRPRIVSIGRLVPWKNVDKVIDAMARLGEGSLIVGGDGPDKERLITHAAAVFPKTSFTGALAHKDVLAVMQDADAFVLNSTYEGFSHLLVEAVSLGVPVVATNAGGNREIISSDADGILVPVADTEALAAAIGAILARKRRTRPEDAITRFTPKAMVATTAALLKSLV